MSHSYSLVGMKRKILGEMLHARPCKLCKMEILCNLNVRVTKQSISYHFSYATSIY